MSLNVNRRANFLASLPLPVQINSDQVSAKTGMLLNVEYDNVHGPQYLVATKYEVARGITIEETNWMVAREVTVPRNERSQRHEGK